MYFLQLKILGIQGSNNFKLVETALKSLSAQEATSALVTTTLTDAEKIRILISKGVTEAEAKKILATAKSTAANVAAAGSTNILTAAWLKLKAAVKGVITTIQAHPILTTLAATAAAIGIVIAAYKKANPSTETLAKNLDDSKQKIQESTQKITEMESELEKVQSRIDELQSMGSLTIVEQKELSNLKESNALLTRNLELEKQKKRLENKQVNENFIKWFDSAMGHKSGLEQSAAIATSVPQPTGDPIANGLGNAVNYLLNKNKDEIYEDNATIGNQFKRIDELLEERKTATGERIEEIENSLKDAFDYLNNIDTELNNEMKDLDLEYTPDAKKGSQEYEINQRIVEAEEFKNKLLLKTADYQGGIPEAYEAVLNNTLDSSRFAEAAKEIEKLKTAEDGTVRKSKDFEKALYEAITKAPDGSNIKELANYLEELGMIKVDPEIGVDGITDFSNAIVESIDETDKATQSNLLFADSFSKIASARKSFEEGLSGVETGTEDFESYADSYEKAMELLNQGYDLDNGVLMAHVERLISDKQLKKLGYDADKVKAYLQEHLKGVFGDKDTDAPGNGLIDKIEKNADENGKIYAKDKNGNIDKTRELASYKDGNWHISDDTKDIEALGKEFGMTTDQILACVKAMDTFSDVNLNDTETIIKQLESNGKIYDPEEVKKKKAKELADKYNSNTNGNVDYNKRPIIEAKKMQKAGWKDFPDGDTATTYSQGVDVGRYSIEITPILENGEVLSPKAFDEYVKSLVGEGSIEDLLKSDTKKLIINAKEGSYKENETYWDNWNNKLDKIKQKHLEVSKMSAVNIKQLEADMQSEGYSDKDIFGTIEQLKNDDNVITVEIDTKTKSSKVAEELEKLGILSGTKTEGRGHNQFEYREINNIDKATEALKTFGLTGQEAYDKIKDISIKDQTGQIVSDAKKLESVLKEFSDFDIKDFTTIWKTDNGKWVENVINVKSLRDTLAEQGWDSSTIDAYIQGLKKEAEKSSNKIVIDTDVNFEEDPSALTSVEEMLAKAGVAKKDGDVYTVDVEQTIKLLQSNNTSSDDATAFLQNLQAQADKANSSLKLEFTTNASTIEGAISNVYTGAAEVKNNIDAANVSLDTYNNKDLSGIRGQLGTTADEAYRNATGLSSTNNEADKLNGREIIYSVIKNEITNTGGTGDANGTANISGTALAGGNWGTAPGGKTLTGELG